MASAHERHHLGRRMDVRFLNGSSCLSALARGRIRNLRLDKILLVARYEARAAMTWKRELAFWAFMGLVGFWFLYGLLSVGTYLSENLPARVVVGAWR